MTDTKSPEQVWAQKYVKGEWTIADILTVAGNRKLEEAAKECDRLAGNPRMYAHSARRAAGQCAAAIRALKSKE